MSRTPPRGRRIFASAYRKPKLLVELGRQAELIVSDDFIGAQNVVSIFKILSLLVGLWLWGLSLWFFLVSVGSLWKYLSPRHKMTFQMTWWSFVFPNTALVGACSDREYVWYAG